MPKGGSVAPDGYVPDRYERPEPFTASWSQTDQLAELRLTGELDLSCADALRVALSDEVQLSGPDIVIDLTDVTFIDSVCLRELLKATARASTTGRAVALQNARGQVLRTLELVALDKGLGSINPG